MPPPRPRERRAICAGRGACGYPHRNGLTDDVTASGFEAVLGEVVRQRALADAHQLGGVLLDAAARSRAPGGSSRARPTRCSAAASATAGRSAAARRAPSTEIGARGDDRARRQHDRALDRVLELAHVARPVVLLQRREHAVVDAARCAGRCAARASARSARRAPGCPRAARAAAAARSG